MRATVMTIDGFPIPVSISGAERSPAVIVLAAADHQLTAYDVLCERLHTAALRTVVMSFDPRLTPKSAIGVLDSSGIQWGVLVGDRAGGEIAWELAATRLDRFTGLVAIDRGHPSAPDLAGAIRDERCSPVRIDTTAVATSPAAAAVARASGRFVYGDYRVVELSGRRSARDATAQLAAEIILRSTTW